MENEEKLQIEKEEMQMVNKFKYLWSILDGVGKSIAENEKRISEGKSTIGMLNPVL